MEPHRKLWNEQQKSLQLALKRLVDIPAAVDLFLTQHAMLHTSDMAQAGFFSFEDELWQGLSEEAARRIPYKMEHSIVWVIWHVTRIEDITMNLLLAGSPQLLHQDSWFERIQASAYNTGNGMTADEIARLSIKIDLAVLQAYRLAVGRRTREIVRELLLMPPTRHILVHINEALKIKQKCL